MHDGSESRPGEPWVTAAQLRKVMDQEPAADENPFEENLRRLLEQDPAYYRELLERTERREREEAQDLATLKAERLQLLARLDQLQAKRDELERERVTRETIASLERIAARDCSCPICGGYVAPAADDPD